MSKLLIVFGATGNQGGSVVKTVINDKMLSSQYTVRAVTRDLAAPAAKALQEKGVEVVKGDADDRNSLTRVLRGAHTVFAVTVTIYDDQTKDREVRQGKTIADAAVAAGAQYLIFSTMPNVAKISGGTYKNVSSFDSKADVEEYIRTLPIESAFFSPGCFMQNFHENMGPRPAGDGTYLIAHVCTAETKVPLIETPADTGKYVGAILANPSKYKGKVFSAATELKSMEQIAQAITAKTGKTVKYMQLPRDIFSKHLPPAAADCLVEMMLYFQDFNYFGSDTANLVEWAGQNARGKLTTFDEYLDNNPIQLQ